VTPGQDAGLGLLTGRQCQQARRWRGRRGPRTPRSRRRFRPDGTPQAPGAIPGRRRRCGTRPARTGGPPASRSPAVIVHGVVHGLRAYAIAPVCALHCARARTPDRLQPVADSQPGRLTPYARRRITATHLPPRCSGLPPRRPCPRTGGCRSAPSWSRPARDASSATSSPNSPARRNRRHKTRNRPAPRCRNRGPGGSRQLPLPSAYRVRNRRGNLHSGECPRADRAPADATPPGPQIPPAFPGGGRHLPYPIPG
jgi:hypothetical protein